MPLDIQSLKERGVKVPVPFFEGQPVIVVYDPIRVSDPAFRAEYNTRARELEKEIAKWSQAQVAEAAEFGKARQDAEDGEEGPEYEPDTMGYSRRVWSMRAELVEMLLKDWEIESDGKHLAVKAEVFTDGTLPPELAQAILREVWADVRSLGNRKPSDSTS